MAGNTCKYCRKSIGEDMIQCATCRGYCHPSCLELPPNILPSVIKGYDWQCNDCKYCYQCHNIQNEEKILFCDCCDRGYHMFCLTPKLKKKPKGEWYCPYCAPTKKPRKNSSSSEKDETEKEAKEESSESNKINKEGKQRAKSDEQLTKETLETSDPRKSKPKEIKKCPFLGCDSSGSTISGRLGHYTTTNCPLAREQRRRERKMANELRQQNRKDSESEDVPLAVISGSATENNTEKTKSPPPKKKKSEQAAKAGTNCTKSTKTPLSESNEVPIENIVSRTDITMFEAAKKKAEEVMAIDRDLAPSSDGVKSICFGNVEIEAWYKSQYPLEYSKSPTLYVCEFCLEYMKKEEIYNRHMAKCTVRHPPGNEIYRKDKLSVFEIDGQKATPYCQNLCLLAKLFLDHKTLWSDVAPFLFYVMTQVDDKGCHMVGYFSKEKVSFLNYNVSCILVLPQHMKKGYGKMLIDFSYLLSHVENKIGSPERPLSDLGLISYRKFWADKLLQYLIAYKEDQITIKAISEKMSIHPNDVVSTLQYLGMLKYWKGKHLILIKQEILEEYSSKLNERTDRSKEIDPSCLKWTPTVYK